MFQLVSSSHHILLPFMFHMDPRIFVLNHRSDAPVLMLRHLPGSFPSWLRSGLTYQWCLIMFSLNSSRLPHSSIPWYSAYYQESTFYLLFQDHISPVVLGKWKLPSHQSLYSLVFWVFLLLTLSTPLGIFSFYFATRKSRIVASSDQGGYSTLQPHSSIPLQKHHQHKDEWW